MESAWKEEQIKHFYQDIIEIIRPLNPLIVFLHRPDLIKSYEKAFKARGNWWRELILGVPEPYGYFKTHEYTGDDSIFASLAYEQEQMSNIFDILACDKYKIDTTDENWGNYIQEITEAAGYEYLEEGDTLPEIEMYCGTYRIQEGDDTWRIYFNNETKQMYTSLFWPYMPMKYRGSAKFELISFPVTLQFEVIEGNMQFIVNGNYDWGYNNKKFIKMDNR